MVQLFVMECHCSVLMLQMESTAWVQLFVMECHCSVLMLRRGAQPMVQLFVMECHCYVLMLQTGSIARGPAVCDVMSLLCTDAADGEHSP